MRPICGFPGGAVLKNPPSNAGDSRDVGLIPVSRETHIHNGGF